jgi:methionyl-tRNA synthetase
MNDELIHSRPAFPKRAVITAGMPYGNKALHFGHIGGVFVHADIFARFLRDRIGPENVLFVSGTDCFGSPIVEHHRRLVETEGYAGSLMDFVRANHQDQAQTLENYDIGIDLFAASALGRAAEIHAEVSRDIFETLLENGHLKKLSSDQFYDPEREVLLNGRQVVGKCPIQGCTSERGYADECGQGHQYMARDLLFPKSTLSGRRPELRQVTNWCVDLPALQAPLTDWIDAAAEQPGARSYMVATTREFFQAPIVHVVKKQLETLEALRPQMPAHTLEEGQRKSVSLRFESLEDRNQACELLAQNQVQFRNGKTLVPFRLSGNSSWGIPVPAVDGLEDLTFWVWPESLWAPISFSAACLEARGGDKDDWRQWWCAADARVYQFIGEDNVYFYGPAEMAMFMGMQGTDPTATPADGLLQLPELVVNRHLLFLSKKASSSGKVRPPMAQELLDYYTPDELRAHFFHISLGVKNTSFRPKPLDPSAAERAADPVRAEGKLFTNVLNRIARSCFYAAQKHTDGRVPVGEVSPEVLERCKETILVVERAMHARTFNKAFDAADQLMRWTNKRWHREMGGGTDEVDPDRIRQVLIDAFHLLRVSTVLVHPIAPRGCEKIREQLVVGDAFWSWAHIFEPVTFFMEDPEQHVLKVLEPREDFFEKHPSQIRDR